MTNRDDFIKQEIRNDFLIDIDRKKLWKIELDIFQEFDRICKKYSLTYFVLGGALIGAVRHKGFVPWDDDMDIGMMRDDLNKFLEVAPKELPEKYFVQYGVNQKGYYSSIVRIRDNDSTGICKIDLGRDINNGIFIELYPFDKVIDSTIKYSIQNFRVKFFRHILYMNCYGKNMNLKNTFSCIISNFIVHFVPRERLFKRMNEIASEYNHLSTEYVNEIVTDYNCKYKYKDLAETEEVDFEYTKVSIPKGYDACLKTTYGDYMKLPPADKRDHHNNIIYYNPNLPYYDEKAIKLAKEYFEKTQ